MLGGRKAGPLCILEQKSQTCIKNFKTLGTKIKILEVKKIIFSRQNKIFKKYCLLFRVMGSGAYSWPVRYHNASRFTLVHFKIRIPLGATSI